MKFKSTTAQPSISSSSPVLSKEANPQLFADSKVQAALKEVLNQGDLLLKISDHGEVTLLNEKGEVYSDDEASVMLQDLPPNEENRQSTSLKSKSLQHTAAIIPSGYVCEEKSFCIGGSSTVITITVCKPEDY